MSFRLQAAIAASVSLLLIAGLAGCGGQFRPTILPKPQGGGDPQPFARAVVLSNNSGGVGGAANIDVTGDTNLFNVVTGRGSVHAGVVNLGVYAANRNEDTVTFYFETASTIPPTTISLPVGAQPVFVNSRESANVYVADSGTNQVSVISTSTASVVKNVTVGTQPSSIAELPAANKVYVANFGSSDVSVISTVDKTLTATVGVGAQPIDAVAAADSAFVYIVNQGGNSVSVIQTSDDTIRATIAVGSSPNFAFFDPTLLRVYVTNTGGGSVSIIDANSGSPTFLTVLATVATGAGPTSVAALADGSKVYVANSGITAPWTPGTCGGSAPGTVSVISAISNTKLHDITVGNTPISLVASPNNNRVTVANCDSDSISEIDSTNDTIIRTLPSAAPKPVFVSPGR
jgi:YVTN family beta-propeller protein